MKKFLIFVLTFSILLSVFAFAGVTASAEGMSPYEYASAFSEAHARRDVLSGAEGAAAATLSSVLIPISRTLNSSKPSETIMVSPSMTY